MLPNLTQQQKSQLSILEPALHKAVYSADYKKAKELAVEIQ